MFLYYLEYCYILPFIHSFVWIWIFFIKSNFFSVKVNTLSKESLAQKNQIQKTHYTLFVKWFSFQLFTLYGSLFFIKGYCCTFLWNQFALTTFNLYIIQNALILLFIILFISNSLTYNNINYNLDFFFAIANIILFLILIIFSNNLFSFIFLLELNSICLFYKFVCSKYWYKVNKQIENNKFDIDNRQIPKNYLNMLFFQYWSTFFSSILLFFSVSNIFYMYGTSDLVILNLLNTINIDNTYTNYSFILLIWLPFFLGFLIKIGLTPIHLFKIEVYKGLPVFSLLFYTTFYFFIYFVSLLLLLNYHLDFLKIIINSIFFIFIISGVLYVVFLIFDINSLKSFFAYSTIINSLLFFIASYLL